MDYTRIEWFPALGSEAVEFSHDWPFKIIRLEGLTHTPARGVSIKAPAQTGATLVDMTVDPRIVSMGIVAAAGSQADLWALRRTLARAFASVPAESGDEAALGLLRIHRPGGLDPLEIQAVPRDSPKEGPVMRGFSLSADLEWEAPYPFFRETADALLRFESEGGLVFPLVMPLAMESYNVEQDVNNLGDVPAPILVRMFGDAETVRIINITTGRTLEVTGAIAAGDYIEVDTAFGAKRITLVEADGTRTSVMDRVNLAAADFWQLAPGVNTVRFEADVNTSGSATLYWRQRYAGL